MTELSENILRLRGDGKTYKEIQEILGCSTSTISYHLGEGQKAKNQARGVARRSEKKLDYRIYKYNDFSRGRKRNCPRDGISFSIVDARKKLEENPVCYLTGKPIDLDVPSSYELDHIIPRSKGGENTIENMGLASKNANRAKHNMDLEEFLDLCYDVLKYHGKI